MRLHVPAVFAALLLGALIAAASLLEAPGIVEGPPGHLFVRDQNECDTCHVVEWKGQVGDLDSDNFTNFFVDVCATCHEENLKRSHPVNVNPYRMVKRDKYPHNLPLQFSEELQKEVMTCVTCHKPHGERFNALKLHSRQSEFPGSGGKFLSYYLRVRGKTTRESYTPLCHACHPKL